MSERFDAIVVGCGAMGAAACAALAERGARTLGLERYRIGHGRGSSHGYSRVVRQAYFEHPDYVPIVRRACERLRELESATGASLFVPCGAIFAGRADSQVVRGSRAAAERHGIAHECWDATRLREAAPGLALGPEFVAVFEPGAGFARPEAVTRAHAAVARRHGAMILEETTVLGWSRDTAVIEVETDRGRFLTERLVVAPGPWAMRLLGELAIAHGASVQVTRQPVVWVRPGARSGSLPVWLVERDDGTAIYGVPELAAVPRGTASPDEDLGPRGMKVAIHGGGAPFDPEDPDRTATPGEIGSVCDVLSEVTGETGHEVVASSVCLYTNSPDSHFVVDLHPTDRRIAFAFGFSGHGFKFAPAIGEMLAELVLDGASRQRAEFLRLGRFRVTATASE